jgi:hypothetical protein
MPIRSRITRQHDRIATLREPSKSFGRRAVATTTLPDPGAIPYLIEDVL